MSLKDKVLAFSLALALCGGGFLVMDVGLMKMQGLSLVFHK